MISSVSRRLKGLREGKKTTANNPATGRQSLVEVTHISLKWFNLNKLATG